VSKPILTDGKGRPIKWPEPLSEGASIEDRIARLRACNDYQDRVNDVANRAFSRSFAEAIERDREELEARGYPEGVDYEALILAEDEDW
jgi:hypothetical protein